MGDQSRALLGVVLLLASGWLVWQTFLSGDRTERQVRKTPAKQTNHYASRDWSVEIPGKLNISTFVYRDLNRNGNYDLGDLPMANIVVRLLRPDQSELTTKSNINGYANFQMSATDPQQAIHQGDANYIFSVLKPPGWQVTSGTATQIVHFRYLGGSVTGLAAETPPAAVGLAPNLAIATRLVGDGGGLPPDLEVLAGLEGQEPQPVTVAAGGDVLVPASPGIWHLQVTSEQTQWRWERQVVLRNAPALLAPVVVGATEVAALPHSYIESFDWLSRSGLDKIPNGHGGLNWDYLLATDNQLYSGPGYVNGLIDGHAVAYNSSGHPVTISARPGERFDFVGGYFTVAWPRAEGETLELAAWRDGEIVATHETSLSYLGPVWLHTDWCGIDKLTLKTRHYWQFVADQLHFRLAQAPAIQ